MKPDRRIVVSMVFIGLMVLGPSIERWIPRKVRAQTEVTQPDKPRVIDQHCKVVADVLPINLETELKKLNGEGILVNVQYEIKIISDKFTIIVCDPDYEEDDPENGR